MPQVKACSPGWIDIGREDVVNVHDFGAIGDGSRDDSVAIQAAIDSLPAVGGTVVLQAGKTYLLTTGLSTNKQGLTIMGAGAATGQSSLVGFGTPRINVSGAITGFTFNPTAASTNFVGPCLRNFYMFGTSSGVGGITINRTNNFYFENVTISDFTGAGAFGIHSDGTGNVNQYGTYVNVQANNCKVGFKNTLTNGLRIFGGQIQADDGGATPVVGATGLQHVSGDTLMCFGLVVQSATTGWDIQSGDGHGLMDCRGEAMTTHIALANTIGTSIMGGSYTNSIIGGIGTWLTVASTCTNTVVMPSNVTSFATEITDSGVTTNRFFEGHCNIGRAPIATNEALTVASLAAGADIATFFRQISATGSGARINLALQDSASADKVYAALVGAITSNASGSHAGELQIQESRAGSLTTTVRFRDGGAIATLDGITAPSTLSGYGLRYIDTADGDYKIKYGDGITKTISVDATGAGTFTSDADSATTVSDSRVASTSQVTVTPTNAAAGLLMRTKTCYVDTIGSGSFVFNVSSTGAGAPAGTETFNYTLFPG